MLHNDMCISGWQSQVILHSPHITSNLHASTEISSNSVIIDHKSVGHFLIAVAQVFIDKNFAIMWLENIKWTACQSVPSRVARALSQQDPNSSLLPM
jgi:hypothetical protein